MDSATWCRTPAAVSAARRLWPEVSKNSSTALFSNEGEFARSTTTCAPSRTSLSPSPVMVLMPLAGEAAMTSCPPWRRISTAFEPIRPVPPMTTIFMIYPPLWTAGRPLAPLCNMQRGLRHAVCSVRRGNPEEARARGYVCDAEACTTIRVMHRNFRGAHRLLPRCTLRGTGATSTKRRSKGLVGKPRSNTGH
jgi:hypothetical protein